MHLCIRLNQLSKHLKNVSCHKSRSKTYRRNSSTARQCKIFAHEAFFSVGNKIKSLGAWLLLHLKLAYFLIHITVFAL